MMGDLFKKIFPWLPVAAFALLAADFYLIFQFAPEEATQGVVQKIFYFHVSCAFAMYLGFGLAGFFSLIYLFLREARYDDYAHAGASVGLVFCTMVLASGPVWAKPIWGTWWTWDPRLTTTLLIWLIFLACLMLRRFFAGDPREGVYAAVLTLFGMLDLPLIFLAVKLWRGIHPSVLGKENNMPTEMKITLIVSNITVLIFFLLIYAARVRLLRLKRHVDQYSFDAQKQERS